MNIISKLDNEPNDVGGLTAGELKGKFDEAGLAIQKYINEVLLPGAENSDNIKVAADTLTNVLNSIRDAAAALREDYDRHAADRENPHAVTKAQVGLGRADNTPDTEKPVSEKQQAALDLKADKEFVILKGAGIEYTPLMDNDPVNKKYADTKSAKTEVIRKGAGEEYTPTDATDPANKGYVDKTVSGVTLGQIPDRGITNEKIALGAVTEEKIQDEAVTTGKIANGAVTEEKLAFPPLKNYFQAFSDLDWTADNASGTVSLTILKSTHGLSSPHLNVQVWSGAVPNLKSTTWCVIETSTRENEQQDVILTCPGLTGYTGAVLVMG